MSGSYTCIGDFLRKQKSPQICMKFSEIEKKWKIKLPTSARKHRPWWANGPDRSLVKWVLAASWRVDSVDMKREIVCFRRDESGGSHKSKKDTPAKRSMTYADAQKIYKERHGRTVKTCWIADVKRKHRKTTRQAHNREGPEPKYPCPERRTGGAKARVWQ